jgi:hypothetical protein
VIDGKGINLYDMLSVLTAAVQQLAKDVRELKEAA